MRIVMLGQECDATSIVYNALVKEYGNVTLILENAVDRKNFLKRRIKNLGLLKVVGQILFKFLLEPSIRRKGQGRVGAILAEYGLDREKTYVKHGFHKVNSVNSEECRLLLREQKPDLVVVNGTRIISKKTLEAVDALFINMHTGITPKYRGVHGAYWALVENDRENCGVTVHKVDTGIDTGGILYQSTIPVTDEDNYYTYPYLQTAVGVGLEIQAMKDYGEGNLKEIQKDLPSKLWSHPTIWEYLKYRRKGVR